MTAPNDLSHLSPEQRRELLAELLMRRERDKMALAPCSYGQRSLWFMHQLAPESSVYNVSFAWRIRSAIDAEAMHRAFRALVTRHEALRTTYESRDGEPWQRVRDTLPDGFEVRRTGPLPEAEFRRSLADDAKRPFDLEHGPLLRATLHTHHEQDHVLLVVIHHIACDLWSVETILSDLRWMYDRETAHGRSAPLPPAPRSYRDFVSWQRAMLDGPEGEAHWAYWRERLGGTLPRIEMPTDRPRPAVQSFKGDAVRFPLPAGLVDGLRTLAASESTTLFTLFFAAYQALLIRYSGQSSVLVGSVTSGRSQGEFAQTVGYFVNPIIFRCDAADDPAFRTLLQRTRQNVLDALDHQDFPFPLLVERLRIERDASHSPFTDFDFVWDKTREMGDHAQAVVGTGSALVQLQWGDVSLEHFALEPVGTPSDLTMVVFEVGSSISINFGYSTDLFDRSTIERMGAHFVALLRAVVSAPDTVLSRLSLITTDERAALAAPPSPPALPSLHGQSLHARFDAQAARRPNALAVSGASGTLTYAALHVRAEALAQTLRTAGVTRGTIVGLFVERDVEMAVAVLGILKAGGAYLPIDRAYPDERVAFMLADSGAPVLVSQRSLATALPGVSLPRIFVDDTAVSAAGQVSEAASPDDIAYVMYTSGSTGRPKGVVVTHRNVMRLFDATSHWFTFTEHDVWALFHSIAFDVSVWELWGALLHGGRVAIIPFAITRAPDQLLEFIARERVTILSQTPSAFRQLIATDRADPALVALDLRFVVCAGEALDVNTLRPWFERRGDERPQIVNMYGITETTVHTTYRRITRSDLGARVRSPIGVAIPDLHLHVLDTAGEPVPVGVPGELYVGGAGVTRGYLNRPDLNAARFLPDPASTDPGELLYRSGDLVRRLANGDMEYLGRIDHQVKVRGFRIELGEIETALSAHPGVDHCAVVVRPDATGETRIVAYVVLRDGNEVSSADLQAFVRRSLPDYMMPGVFVRLAALPLTSNSKLDVNALPLPVHVESASTRAFAPPGTAVEGDIAAEWRRILDVERIGIDDDFFELGGHSIMATGLARWMNTHFRIDFPVYAVFESPTIAGMARRAESLIAGSNTKPASDPEPGPREEFDA